MKLNRRILVQVVLPLLLALVLLTFNHCGVDHLNQRAPKNKQSLNQSTSSPSLSTDTVSEMDSNPVVNAGGDPTEPEEEIVIQEVHVGVKNFEELNQTMSLLTGVPTSASSITNLYRDLQVQLPTSNDIKSLLSINQLSMMKLSAEYCHLLVEDGTKRAVIWPTTVFSEAAQTAVFGAKRTAILDAMMLKFWKVQSQDLASYQAERIEMGALIDELLVGMNLASSTTTRTIIKSVCTAALSSAHVTLL